MKVDRAVTPGQIFKIIFRVSFWIHYLLESSEFDGAIKRQDAETKQDINDFIALRKIKS